MDIYDNLHDVISRAIWDAFKPGTEPPDAEALRKAVRGQLRLYLHMSLYPHYEKLIGVIDEDAFTDSLVKEFWEKRAVKQTDGNYLFHPKATNRGLMTLSAMAKLHGITGDSIVNT